MADQKTAKSNFSRFLKDNRTLMISIPVLIIAVIVALVLYSNMSGSGGLDANAPVLPGIIPADMHGNQVEVLPQTERTTGDDGTAISAKNSASDGLVKNPFDDPVRLTGVLIKEDGESVAILEAGAKTFIVKVGDTLENGMAVVNISLDSVLLDDYGNEIQLSLKQ